MAELVSSKEDQVLAYHEASINAGTEPSVMTFTWAKQMKASHVFLRL